MIIELDNVAKIVFSNAEFNRSFNKNTDEGVKQLESLKCKFNVNEVIYLNQVHSDNIFIYNNNNITNKEGDAIITDNRNVIIGVFTADCVPIILVDPIKKVCAAIHSGWRGTFNSITLKTIEKMKNEFNCNAKNIKVYIGPHIRSCCYEISEELKEKFLKKKKEIKEANLFNKKNLNLEECILNDLSNSGVKEENINTLDLCTYCSEEIKLHSYRKSNGNYGRMFTFIILE
ncbi:UNVERIFIED_ORG: laccase [Clostridium botulinum]|uniref:Purine nucleoside phosphorylase n=1 Tax=Clostridium botulinum TaxID=1491 RepID=A0A6M0SM02_CLOBO|nr:peptidoglycan editing factor PgeF [Clostridium botulinum]MBY6808895.1 peptidoglycan editing factor PgeF [Clostridium botulinum]MBY6822400.1 peptidoglycan editing factor PgeF [Clostridium botulinum]MBY6832810.1 peptidoglycan editing factor PgeF [Clostridium botulinum]MBY6917023.1 peptidoglycan editing factor PgeF [Clostridium botulinum]MBY6929710.1 peptidoglycan editing factor PgeF [Clostridium botulinum]